MEDKPRPVRVLSSKIIGYSSDFKKTHTEATVLYSDGTTRMLYKTNVISLKGIYSGSFRKERPYVERPTNQ